MFTQVGKEHLLENKLKEIKEDFDFILLDNCPALNLLNIMALTAVSSNGGVIIPLEPSRFCLTGLEQLVNHMKLIKQYYNNNLKILGLLVVRFKSNTNLNKTILNNLPNIAINYDTNLFKTCIRNSIKIPENQLLGIPISDDKSNALTDYENFVNELLEVL